MQYGYLFGHYDSRGGATLVLVDEHSEGYRNAANDAYVEAFVAPDDPNEYYAWKAFLEEEDFLAPVTIEGDPVGPEDGDLEYRPSNRGVLLVNTEDNLRLREDRDSAIGIVRLKWLKDATVPELLEDNQPHPEHPGWEYSNFGEDACGVVVQDVRETEEELGPLEVTSSEDPQ